MTSSITWVDHDPAARDRMLRILSLSREKESRDEPSRMNIGIALKIVNLLLKHMSFSEYCKNERIFELLHVPWDSFTLSPLRSLWTGDPPLPDSPSQGFVKTLDIYQQLHTLITRITREAGVPRITYDLLAWDKRH